MEQRILGDYQIIKPIGQGALGMAYLAEHRFIKRQYILKVLPEELSTDRGFIQRFEEDIAVIASLDHPNIVKIYNISFAQGCFFLVTDCIVDEMGETTNLAQYLANSNRSLNEEEIFQILKQIAEALDYAKGKKIRGQELAHRCIKLNNILIGSKKQTPGIHVYLSDFGLSRIIGSGAVLTRTYKNVAEAIGINTHWMQLKQGQETYPNPSLEDHKLQPLHLSFLQNYTFLAPEQKQIDSSYPIGAQADVYAFGVLAYYLLMKELPEGVFDFPSSLGFLRYQWDALIRACLQCHPDKRPTQILPILEAVRSEKVTVIVEEINEKEMDKPLLIEEADEVLATIQVNIQAKEEVMANSSSVAYVETTRHADKEEVSCGLKPMLKAPQLERPQTDPDPAAIFQVNSSVKTYNPEPKDITNINPLMTDMVIIPGGSFFRGSQDGNRDETPRHQITLNSFAIDIHPVTNEQFVRFLEVMGGEKDNQHNDIIRLRDSRIKRSAGKLSIESGYTKHPVVGVTWYGAVAYAKWVGKRLPTEAEWEIASRGGHEQILYPTGDEVERSQANFFSSDTTAVMSYAPNGYGLYDVTGNVYEWCHDWYGYNYYEVSIQEPDNPQGPIQGVYRVLRGGCWKSLKEDLRCSRRHRNNPGTVNGTYGFRCAAAAQGA